ncbi:MAG: DNA translocase FtsK 4TM domain-containing protein [Clostridia bacterium]
MGRKRKKQSKKTMKNDLLGGILIVISLVFIVFLSFDNMGMLSELFSNILKGCFGISAYCIPIVFMIIGVYCIVSDEKIKVISEIIKGVIATICISSVIYIFTESNFTLFNNFLKFCIDTFNAGNTGALSGTLGGIFANCSVKIIGILASKILLIFIAVVSVLYFLKMSLTQLYYCIYNVFAFIANEIYKVWDTVFKKDESFHIKENKINKRELKRQELKEKELNEKMKEKGSKDALNNINTNTLEQVEFDFNKLGVNPSEGDLKAKEQRDDFFKKQIEKKEDKSVKEVLTLDHGQLAEENIYEFPPISLLGINKDADKGLDKKAIHATAVKLQKTLSSFGVEAKVTNITKGPTVTRYELSPSIGVKVSKIVNLADDIALNLAAKSIRIEAPIPGKAAVGIEVPNPEPESVFLREVIESKDFTTHKSALAFALGKDAAGDTIVGDIAKMPHVLIAGATGSGKSVCINSIIVSIIYKSKPSEVKMILVDPKIVELSVYNGIPHLLIPVVTDPKKAAGALNWAVQEMVNRYSLFASKGVKDIKGYNAEIEKETNSVKMPQIVIIIDELADLMMVAPNDVEDAICRLAQMARAAGMHLVIATQRPSVDVITGIIKANVPSRIAFTVSSNVDSRTILDMAGAEKLLGKGDMLYFPVGATKPQRIQGTWISEKEIEEVVNSVKKDDVVVYNDDIIESIEKVQLKNSKGSSNKDPNSIEDPPEEDPILNDAIDLVMDMGQASASMLQRRFKIGYSRAGRLVDQMEDRGLISGYDGSKPRQLLISKEEWQELKFSIQQAAKKEE